MEFEKKENSKGYIVQKKIDGDFWYEGTFRSIQGLANICVELGRRGIEEVRVREVGTNEPNEQKT